MLQARESSQNGLTLNHNIMKADNWIVADNKPQATVIDSIKGPMWSDYVLMHVYNSDNQYDELGARIVVGYYHYYLGEWHDINENVRNDVSHWTPLASPQGLNNAMFN